MVYAFGGQLTSGFILNIRSLHVSFKIGILHIPVLKLDEHNFRILVKVSWDFLNL